MDLTTLDGLVLYAIADDWEDFDMILATVSKWLSSPDLPDGWRAATTVTPEEVEKSLIRLERAGLATAVQFTDGGNRIVPVPLGSCPTRSENLYFGTTTLGDNAVRARGPLF